MNKLSKIVHGFLAQTRAESSSHSWDELCKKPYTCPQSMWGAFDEEDLCSSLIVELDNHDKVFSPRECLMWINGSKDHVIPSLTSPTPGIPTFELHD